MNHGFGFTESGGIRHPETSSYPILTTVREAGSFPSYIGALISRRVEVSGLFEPSLALKPYSHWDGFLRGRFIGWWVWVGLKVSEPVAAPGGGKN